MKKNLIAFLNLMCLANLVFFILLPVASQAIGDVGTEIDYNLAPIADVYGNPSPDQRTIAEVIADIIKIVLGFLAVIFLVLIIYAGFMWMTAAGNEEKIDKAKKIMTAAVIGVAIVLAAYAITYFVIDQLLMALRVSTMGL